MGHYRMPIEPGWTAKQRNMLADVRVLIDRYKARNDPGKRLDAEQRKAWAAEMVDVLGVVAHALGAHLGPEPHGDDLRRRRAWVEMFERGLRPVKPLPQDDDSLRTPLPHWRKHLSDTSTR